MGDKMSLVVAVRKYLLIEGEGAAKTIELMKPLTPADRADLARYFEEQGIPVEDRSATN